MRPLAYGYVRVCDGVGLTDLPRADRALRFYSRAEGFEYAATFVEYEPDAFVVFDDLARELRRTECRRVFVLSMENLCDHEIIRRYVLDRIAIDADASFCALPDSTWTGADLELSCVDVGGSAG